MATYMRRNRGESLYSTSEWMVRGGIICGIAIGWIAFMGVVVIPACGALVRWWFS